MKETLITIVMPVFNAEAFLNDCIQSIVDQSYSNWELLAVDDQSTDESLGILEGWSKKDPRIHCFKNKEKGLIHALRLAYSKSKGELITRMDADDLMHKAKLSKMSKALLNKGKGNLAVCGVHYFKEEGPLGEGYKRYASWLNELTIAERNYDEIYKECVIPSPGWMCYRSDFDTIGAFNSSVYPEDYDLAFRFRKGELKVVGVPTKLHLWRDHESRASRNDPNYIDHRFIDLKTDFFLKEDHDPGRTTVLWGAGSKGKAIAQIFIDRGIDFDWITETPKKQGINIYGKVLKGPDYIDFKQIIVAVAGDHHQKDIRKKIGALRAAQAFYFC